MSEQTSDLPDADPAGASDAAPENPPEPDVVREVILPELPDTSALPYGFIWGAATASFQIEGAADERGTSIWDTFCREPGRIKDGSNGDVACDHVNRYEQDVALLKDLGVDAYRFSISWPRMMPDGRGKLADAGLSFYDRLVDALLEAGIQPWITLYHWDLPQTLQDAGGWTSRDIVGPFVDYASAVHAALGDRVRNWMTLNEPWCSAWLGHAAGVHAPGLRDVGAAVRASHHLLLAHGAAVAALRAQAPADHAFGIVLNPGAYRPAEELAIADAASVVPAATLLDGIQTRWWLDSLLLGVYPQDVLNAFAPYLDGLIAPGDLDVIAQPLDFLGINYYSDHLLQPREADGFPMVPEMPGTESVSPLPAIARPGRDFTDIGWPITPDGLRAMLVRISQEYPAVPLMVTENGAAYDDDPAVLNPLTAVGAHGDAPIPDPRRQSYLRQHLASLAAAAAQGVDVRGYFAWSLMDNFEWAFGYSQRFGLVRVDYDTLQRRPRASYHDLRAVIEAQRTA